MTLPKAIETLTEYQKWRLGNDDIPSPIPKVITQALDVLLNYHIVDTNKMVSTQTDENGKPLTYWGGLKDRTCTNDCSVVCGECQILHISDDCEEVKNWDSFVEQKNKELFYQKQVMNPYSSDSQSYTAYEKGFIEGFEQAKEIEDTQRKEMYFKGIENYDPTFIKTKTMKTRTSSLMDSHLVDFTNPNANNIKSSSTTSSQTERMYSEEQLKLAYMQGYNRGVLGIGDDMESYIKQLKQTIKWQ